jgi:N utilization substance protein B
MGRRASREIAMKLLYQLEIQKEDKEQQIQTVLDENELTENDRRYITDVISGVFDNVSYLDKLIEKNSKGWKLNRIPKVDLSILRLGSYEICFREDIPYSVTVNEAVELAKKYSGEDAGAFINGILSHIPKLKIMTGDNSSNQPEINR